MMKCACPSSSEVRGSALSIGLSRKVDCDVTLLVSSF